MNAVSLINKHGLTVADLLIIVIIVKSGGSGPASHNRAIRLNPATLELLLAMCFENTFKVAFTHPVANFPENFNVTLNGDLGSPAHHINLLRGLSDTAVG